MKTKRFLSAMMVIVMIAVMLPFGAIFASASTATYAETTVALVNGAEVAADGLQAAIDAATEGGTIEIVKDFTTGRLTINNGAWTINGNNKVVTSTETTVKNSPILIINNGEIEIENLTIKTLGSGIQVKGSAKVEVTNLNIYAGGTKEGLTVEASAREDFSPASKVCAMALDVQSYNALLVVNSGTYKAYGTDGCAICSKGNTIVYNGNFIGENSTFVGRAAGDKGTQDMGTAKGSLTIYGGLWIKPVINKNVLQNSDGSVIRADSSSVVTIYGGTFACFSGANKIDGVNKGSLRDYVLIAGTSSDNSGWITIFGGDFYSFMTAECNANASQCIGSFAGNIAEGNKSWAQQNYFIYGGNFYSSIPSREVTLDALANKSAVSVQRIDNSMYNATTEENLTVTVYGKEFTGVKKWAISYVQPEQAPADASVKVTNPDGKVYYLNKNVATNGSGSSLTWTASTLAQAINGIATEGSTITLLDNITLTSTLSVIRRYKSINLDMNGKTITGVDTAFSANNVCVNVVGNDAASIHTWNGGVETTPATHTTTGVKTYTCTVCNATKTEDIAKTTEHAHGDWTKVDDAKHSKTCACGDVIEADHAWDEGVVTTEPTVEAEGVKTYTCADCGATKTESIEKLPAPDTGDNTTPDAGNADGADDAKSGCGNAIGFGAVAVVAVAGLACTLVAKKRED